MPKTANAYTPDQGEVTVEITAADFAALSADFTQADTIIIDGVVRKFEETTTKTKEYSELYVTGDTNPIKTISSKVNATVWSLTIVDDYSSGGAGEWGSDAVSAVQIFQEFFDLTRVISQMTVTPAGGASPFIETTLLNVDVQSVGHPLTDADSNAPNEVTIILVVESYTKAAHA